jgi:hypothetical protein
MRKCQHPWAAVLASPYMHVSQDSKHAWLWQVCLSGQGTHLGLEVAWQIRSRADGAFVEQIVGQHLSFTYGHPGVGNGSLLRQGWGVRQLVLHNSSLLCLAIKICKGLLVSIGDPVYGAGGVGWSAEGAAAG